jgi:hypothetical protein
MGRLGAVATAATAADATLLGRATVAHVCPASSDTERPLSNSIHADEPERLTDPGRSPVKGALVGELEEFEGVPDSDGSGLATRLAVGDVDDPGARTTTRKAVATTMATTPRTAMDANPLGIERLRRAGRRGSRRRKPASCSSCSK